MVRLSNKQESKSVYRRHNILKECYIRRLEGAENNVRKVYYSAMLVRTDNYSNSGTQRGSFTSGTPLKKFSLSKTRPGTYQVVVNIYSDSAERHYIGTARSAKIYIKR